MLINSGQLKLGRFKLRLSVRGFIILGATFSSFVHLLVGLGLGTSGAHRAARHSRASCRSSHGVIISSIVDCVAVVVILAAALLDWLEHVGGVMRLFEHQKVDRARVHALGSCGTLLHSRLGCRGRCEAPHDKLSIATTLR